MIPLRFLLMMLIVSEAHGNLKEALQTIQNTSNWQLKESPKMKLIADIIEAKPGNNIVMNGHLQDLENVFKVNFGMNYATKMELDKLGYQDIQDLKRVHLQDNKPNFYMVLSSKKDTDAKIQALTSLIQNTDFNAQIAILYEDYVND